MSSEKKLPRRDFLRNAVMLAGAGVTAPLWAAMKYDKNAVLRYFREQASATDVRVKAGIEANRKGDVTLLFTDAQGRPCESVHVKVRQLRHDFKYGANLFGLSETKNGSRSTCSTPTPSSAGQSRSRNAPSPPVPRIPATRRCRQRSCATSTASGSRTRRWRRLSTGTSPTPIRGSPSSSARSSAAI